MKILYLPELLVFEAQVTKISVNPANNSPTSKKGFNNCPSDIKTVKRYDK